MRKFTSLAIFALMWLVGTAAFADDHGYVNGICTMHDACDAHFEAPQQDADGFYMLYNAGNVEWISQEVANGSLDLDCKLMNDIDFENIENLHRPIGPNDGKKYNATFDGQGHLVVRLTDGNDHIPAAPSVTVKQQKKQGQPQKALEQSRHFFRKLQLSRKS